MEIWNLVFIQDRIDADSISSGPPREERRHRLVAGTRRDAPAGRRQRLRDGSAPPDPRGRGVPVGTHPRQDPARRRLPEDHRGARPRHGVPDRGRRPAVEQGRGYILRRMLRRVGLARATPRDRARGDEPIIDVVVGAFGDAYPELRENEAFMRQVAGSEEERFAATLRQGLVLFEDAKGRATRARVSGEDAFKLSDTFGFPLQLTEELAEEAGLSVDTDRFAELLEEQRRRARDAAKKVADRSGRGRGPARRRSSATTRSRPTPRSCRCSTRSSASCPRPRRARRSGSSSTARRSTPRAEDRSAIEG